MKRIKGKCRFKCLRCGNSLTTDGSLPKEKDGGECIGDRKGKHWWTSY
ncbi:MAG: hypothetical protein KJ955_07460 [Nanoarchaeota archaeon]|nr:hypothetical protein [Nanoarchaeota archaeon]